MESVLERLTPTIDLAIEKLSRLPFKADPIAGERVSRITSIMSSAYKRHGLILEGALTEALKDCSRLRVWREEAFKLSHESLRELHVRQGVPACLAAELLYGEKEQVIPIDIIVHDRERGSIRAYNLKRGNGSYDGVKRKSILNALLRTHMLLRDYGRNLGIEARDSHAHAIFYYGVVSLPKPLALTGQELDDHFGVAVREPIEQVNRYFKERLATLINE